MELNKTYCVNIIRQLKTDVFIVVPKSNEITSKQYVNYHKNLLTFKECRETNEWFEKLEYPHIEIGKVVLVKINNMTNGWARGIISKYKMNNLSSEIYLIDSQTFVDRNKHYELRICPSKYLRLKLPTFYICIDLCFNVNDTSLKNAIEIMIRKNQHDELNIIFTPKSMQNNVYFGSLAVNNLPLKRYLQILLKKDCTKKEYKSFNPLKFHHLKNIFIPKHSSNLAFLGEGLVSSFSDLSSLNDSLENSSSNCLTDIIDYSEDFRDSSSNKTIGSSKNSCVIPISKQKVCSSKSSSSSRNKSSTCSLYKDHNSLKCLSGNRQIYFTEQNDEKYQVPINPETASDNKVVLDHSLDYSEDFTNDTSLTTIESSKNSCIIPIANQKICSSKSPPLSRSNSSYSLDKEDNSPEYLSGNKPTNFTRQNDEKYQVLINTETTSDDKDVLDHSIDYSKHFTNDPSLTTIESSKNSCIIPITKQKVCSSKSPLLSRSNSSTCSLNEEDNSPECLSENKPTNFTRQNNEKHQVSINPEITADNKDESKSNVENTSAEIGNQNINKEKPFIYSLMKKRSGAFRQEAAECQKNNSVKKISNVLETSNISSVSDDSKLWWSSDDGS